MKLLIYILVSYLFSTPHPLLAAQEPKEEKPIIKEQKKSFQLKKALTAEEIKINEENAEKYRNMIAALGGKMLEAKL